MTYEEAAMVEPFSVGIHAVRRGRLRAGETVVIMGMGPIGLRSGRFRLTFQKWNITVGISAWTPVKKAWEVVAEANMENGGILVDAFHYYRGGSRLEDLKAVPTEKLFLVHLNDAMNLPVKELVGAKHRLYPGDGVIPLSDILSVLKDKNYDRVYAVRSCQNGFGKKQGRFGIIMGMAS